MSTTQQQAQPSAYSQPAPTALLDKIVEEQQRAAARYKPVMSPKDAAERYEQIKWYYENVMTEGIDYGRVPGVDKPFLFKPGAQGLCTFFGYVPQFEITEEIEDWTGERHSGEPLFYYRYRCVLWKDDARVGEGVGSANSWESKYRYRWLPEEYAKERPDFATLPKRGGKRTLFEFDFALNKRETSGKYGKPAEYWERFDQAIQTGEARPTVRKTKSGDRKGYELVVDETQYRIPNDGFPDVINTTQKQGTKRAYIEATLSATGASRFFSQDEDAVKAMMDFNPQPYAPPAVADDAPPIQKDDERKPAPEPGSQYPEPVRQFCLKLQACKGANDLIETSREVMRLMSMEFERRDPQGAAAKYNAIVEEWKLKRKGQEKTPADFIALTLDVWQAIEHATKEPDHDGVTDTDVPR